MVDSFVDLGPWRRAVDPGGFGRFAEELEIWARNGTFEQKLDFLRFRGKFPLWETETGGEKSDNAEYGARRTPHEVAEIFLLYGEEYRRKHALSPEQGRAMFDMERCCTNEFGSHWDVCDMCGHLEKAYCS